MIIIYNIRYFCSVCGFWADFLRAEQSSRLACMLLLYAAIVCNKYSIDRGLPWLAAGVDGGVDV